MGNHGPGYRVYCGQDGSRLLLLLCDGDLESVLEDGDIRAVPVALRTVAEAMGGMTALAARTGLSRETLYRTLSEKGIRASIRWSSSPQPSCQQ